MELKQFLDQLQTQITHLLETAPAKDLEKNIRAVITQGVAKLDVITREEFETQTEQLSAMQGRLQNLEQRIQELETMLAASRPHTP